MFSEGYINRSLVFTIITVIMMGGGYFIHNFFWGEKVLPFSLSKLYIFLFFSTQIVCLLIELVFWKLPNQTGVAFLSTVFVKIGIFTLMFKSVLLSDKSMEMSEKLSIMLPFFAFLFAEAIYSFRLLNKS